MLFHFIRRLMSVVYLMNHPAVPLRLKLLPVLAVVYVVFPKDLWLDLRPFGLIDDALVGIILLSVFSWRAQKHILSHNERRSGSIPVDYEIKDRDGDEAPEAQHEPPDEDLRS